MANVRTGEEVPELSLGHPALESKDTTRQIGHIRKTQKPTCTGLLPALHRVRIMTVFETYQAYENSGFHNTKK